jgi:hypothetical protein
MDKELQTAVERLVRQHARKHGIVAPEALAAIIHEEVESATYDVIKRIESVGTPLKSVVVSRFKAMNDALDTFSTGLTVERGAGGGSPFARAIVGDPILPRSEK